MKAGLCPCFEFCHFFVKPWSGTRSIDFAFMSVLVASFFPFVLCRWICDLPLACSPGRFVVSMILEKIRLLAWLACFSFFWLVILISFVVVVSVSTFALFAAFVHCWCSLLLLYLCNLLCTQPVNISIP